MPVYTKTSHEDVPTSTRCDNGRAMNGWALGKTCPLPLGNLPATKTLLPTEVVRELLVASEDLCAFKLYLPSVLFDLTNFYVSEGM